MTRKRAVVSADPADLEEVERLVGRGAYATVSEFVRQAVAEKLEREKAAALAEEVEAYVRAGHGAEDLDLSSAQAFDEPSPKRPKKGRRAKG